MQKKNQISNEQIKALVITTMVGVGILSLPSDIAMVMGTGGWLAIIIGGLLFVPFIVMIDKLFKMHPGKSIFQISREIMHPIIVNLFSVIFLIYIVILLSYSIRIFAEVIKAYLLKTTPTEVIIITMLIAISYIARSKIEAVARMAVMIYPIIIGFVIFLVLVNLPHMDKTNIYPVLNIDYKVLPKGIMTTLFSYIGYEIILLTFNLSENKDESLKYSLRGLFIVIVIYLMLFFITLSQYGVYQLQKEIWPSIAVVKEVDLPGFFLENLDGIAMASWVMVVYGTMGPFLYATGLIFSDVLKAKSPQIFIPFLLPIIYIIALLPDNLLQVHEILGAVLHYLAVIAIFIIPTIIFIISYIKRGSKT